MKNIQPRKTWIAVLLAIASPFFSMLYLGRGWRAFLYLMAKFGSLFLAIFLAWKGIWPSGISYPAATIPVTLIGIFDSVRICRSLNDKFAGPWFSRWWGILLSAAIFVVVVLMFRWVFFEPFRIPALSMAPTLISGDCILVDKQAYGLHPLFDLDSVENSKSPQRGDVVVFRPPHMPQVVYIKRIVAIPGDELEERDRVLYLNGKAVPQEESGEYSGSEPRLNGYMIYKEQLDKNEHRIMGYPYESHQIFGCSELSHGPIRIPEDSYFLLGDNRGNSADSRCFGTVKKEELLGKAILIWWNTKYPQRAVTSIQ